MSAKKGTVILSLIAVIAIVGLYFSNLSVDRSKKAEDMHAHQEMPQGKSFEEYESDKIKSLPQSEQSQAQNLKNNWLQAKDRAAKIQAAYAAANFWQPQSPELEAYYHYLAADLGNNAQEQEEVGDHLYSLYKETGDDEIRNNLVNFATRAYEDALKQNSEDAELKLKAGTAYIEGSSEPMKGITLIREVLKADPKNIHALILLGRFSLVSGQYDKAKERLDEALAINPDNTEAMYFKAFAEQGLGNVDKAIELLETCKKRVNNPNFDQEIDKYIEDLKSNKK